MYFVNEYVTNYVQQNFYVLGPCDALRSITYKCFDCRRFKDQVLQPQIADLLNFTFQQNKSPVVFTNVGIDHIGPFTVIQWNEEKRTISASSIVLSR